MKKYLIYIIVLLFCLFELESQETTNSRMIIFDRIGQREEIKINDRIQIVYGKNIKTEYVYLNYIQGKSPDKYIIELKTIEPFFKEIAKSNFLNDSLKNELSNYSAREFIKHDTINLQFDDKNQPIDKFYEYPTIDSLINASEISDDNIFIEKMPKIKTLIDAVDYVRKQNKQKISNNIAEIKKIDREIDSINNILNQAQPNSLSKGKINQYLKEIELLKLKKKEMQLLNEQLSFGNQILEKELVAKNAEYEALLRLIYIMVLLIILILVISFTIYYNYRQKKKYNKQLSEINDQLENINKELLKSNLDKENLISIIKGELNLASKYVISLLPKKLNDINLAVEWIFKPSEELGGDSFGYHYIDNENFAIYLIDVSGHGVGAALHSVQVLNILQNSALPNIDFKKPDEVLNSLNNIFQMNNYSGLYFTIFYAVYNIQSKQLKYSAAGHPPMLLIKNGSTQKLESQNIFIGAVKNINYTSDAIEIDSKDKLIVFSDGAFELIDKENKVWTFDDFYDRINKNRKDFKLDKVYSENLLISGSTTLDDDFSLIQLSFH